MCIEMGQGPHGWEGQSDSECLNLLPQKMGHLRFLKEMFIEKLPSWGTGGVAGRTVRLEEAPCHQPTMHLTHLFYLVVSKVHPS